MADITSRELEQLIDTLRDHTNVVSRHLTKPNLQTNNSYDQKKLDKAHAESESRLKTFSKHVGEAAGAASQVDDSLNKFHKGVKQSTEILGEWGRSLKTIAGVSGVFVSAIGLIANDVRKAGHTYRQMVETGQSFGGSLVKMQQAAAGAALPLDEFADVVKNNTKVIATTGVQTFTDISKGVRTSLRDFGMLGMTTEQLNEHLGEYMETQRLYGMTGNLQTERTANSMSKLAIETTKLSEMTGKSRMEISKQTASAMRDMSMVSRMMLNSGGDLTSFGENADKAVRYLAAMPGQAGETLSRMLSQTIGKGTAMLTDDLTTFLDGGAHGVVELMETMRMKVENGTFTAQDSEDFKKRFLNEIEGNLEAIKHQSDTGNESATKVLQMYSEMRSLRDKSPKELADQEAMTKALMGFEDITKRVTSYMQTHYYKVLGRVVDVFNDFTETEAFDRIKEQFEGMVAGVGNFIDGFFTEENLGNLTKGVTTFVEVTGTLTSWGLSIISLFAKPIAALQEQFGSLSAAIVGVIGFFSGKFLLKMIFGKIIGSITGVFDRAKEMAGLKSVGGSAPSPFAGLKKSPTGSLRVWVDNQAGLGGRGRRGAARGTRGGRADNRARPTRQPQQRTAARVAPPNVDGKQQRTRTRPPASNLANNAGRAARFAGTAANMARGFGLGLLINKLDSVLEEKEDFTGKETAQAGLSAANMALTGAALGSIIPGLGTVVGGAIGGIAGGGMALYQNWDAITEDMSNIGSAIANFFSGDDSEKKKTTPVPAAPTTPPQPEIPKVPEANAELMEEKLKELRDQVARESAETSQTVNKLIEFLAETTMSNNNNLNLLLDEMRKANRHLSSIDGQ